MTKLTQLGLEGEGGKRRIHLREISGDSDTPTESVGQDLRTARLRRGEDLATVSRALKIRKEHLEAVEEDRIEDLPGKTYAIGFVRSYSNYLGLDAVAMLARFKEEISGRPVEHAYTVTPIPDDEPRNLPNGWRIVAGIVVLLLGYGAWHLFSASSPQVSVPPAPLLNPPKAAAPKPAPAPQQTAAAAPEPSNANPPASNATPAAPATGTAPSASMSAVPAQTAAKPDANDNAVSTIGTSGGTVYGEQNKDPRVVLKVKGDARVTVRSEDGSLYLNRDLKAGDSYLVPNLPGLYLATSNAGMIDVAIDGKAMGSVGQSQEILGRVSLEPESLVDRFNAH